MEPLTFTDGGVALIFALFVIKELFAIIKGFIQRKNGNNGEEFKQMITEIHELWSWHNVTDDDGVKLWYVRRSLEDAIKLLADNVAAQTKVFEQLIYRLDRGGKE